MKVGVLVESGRQGMEAVFCRRLCEFFAMDDDKLEWDIVPMDNKQLLIELCAAAVKSLLADRCDRVVILWDERPAWPDMHEKLCWHNDRLQILTNLAPLNLKQPVVHLVCIEREFESWLLFDERMVSCVLSTDAHPVKVKCPKHPDRLANPKGVMMKLFKENGGGRYMDYQFAPTFARCLSDLKRLRKCKTFRRFEERITENPT